MVHISEKKYLVLVFLLIIPSFSWAYLDPGTGSLLLYAVVGILASLGFALKNVFYRLKSFVLSSASIKQQNLTEIVFFSEGGAYWHVFEPIITEMVCRSIPSTFITSDKNDPAFKIQGPLFTVIRPGNEMVTITYMNKLKAKLVVSTTPHLDIYMWRRSKDVARYAHLFHAPDCVDFYEKYALSFYDDIFLTGPDHEQLLIKLDALRNLSPKRIHPVGCTYFDYMLKELKNLSSSSSEFRVLYAPSWGERSSIIRYGTKIIDNLILESIPVVFRPHPQYRISHPELLEGLKQKYSQNPLVTIDEKQTAIQSMVDCNILIADISGIIFDYAYLFAKPIFLLNSEISLGGFEAEDLGDKAWTIPALQKLSQSLYDKDIPQISAIVTLARRNQRSIESELRKFREENLYNFGSAGIAAVDAISKILHEVS